MGEEISYKYIEITAERCDKTLFSVSNKKGHYELGMIAWFPGWHCYVFQPNHATEYSADCLNDIAHFMNKTSGRLK